MMNVINKPKNKLKNYFISKCKADKNHGSIPLKQKNNKFPKKYKKNSTLTQSKLALSP